MLPSAVRVLSRLINGRSLVPACFILAFLIRCAYVLVFRTTPDIADSKWYVDVASSVVEGRGVTINGAPTASWPVGYALFLAALFKIVGISVFAAKWVNIALYLGSMFFAHKIARRIFNTPVANASILVMALYPNHIAYTVELMSEILFLFLFLFALHLFLYNTYRSLALSGFVFGLLVYVKPQGFFLPGLLILLFSLAALKSGKWVFTKTLLVRGALCYAIISLIILPWTIRNYNAFGKVTLINTNGGTNLFLGNHPAVQTRFGMPFLPDGTLAGILGRYGVSEASGESVVSDILGQETIAVMKADPLAVVARWPGKLLHMWAMDVEGARLNEREIMPIGSGSKRFLYYFKIFGQLYYLLIMAGFLVFAWALLRRKIPWTASTWMAIAAVGYFTAISLVFHGESRYHFPLMPLIIINACAGIHAAFQARGPRSPAAR